MSSFEWPPKGSGGGGGGGVTTIGTIDSGSPSADGATIISTSLIMQSASVTMPGLVNNSAQEFSGQKTFTDPIFKADSGTNKAMRIDSVSGAKWNWEAAPATLFLNLDGSSAIPFSTDNSGLVGLNGLPSNLYAVDIYGAPVRGGLSISNSAFTPGNLLSCYSNGMGSILAYIDSAGNIFGANLSGTNTGDGADLTLSNLTSTNISVPLSGSVLTVEATGGSPLILAGGSGNAIIFKIGGTTEATLGAGSFSLSNNLPIQLNNNSQVIGLRASSTASASYTITFPDAAPGTNTSLSYDGTNYVWASGGGGGGVTTVGTFDTGTATSDALWISGSTIYAQSADGSNPGMVNVGTQTFGGDKTFTQLCTFSAGVHSQDQATIVGASDLVQLDITGFASQSNPLFRAQISTNASGTIIDSNGNLMPVGAVDIGGSSSQWTNIYSNTLWADQLNSFDQAGGTDMTINSKAGFSITSVGGSEIIATSFTLNVNGSFLSYDGTYLNLNNESYIVNLNDPLNAQDAATKNYVDTKVAGASGSFLSADAKTVTVVNGLITSIV